MKVVVTGGAGFIGSHLAEKLVEYGCNVTVIDNLSTGRVENMNSFVNQIEFIETDLSKTGQWQNVLSRSDLIFHLAGLADIVPSIEKPEEYFSANVTATLNVMESARKNKVRTIYSASSSCYGKAEQFPTPEDAPIKPEYPYAMTKRMGEELVLHWGKVYNIPVLSTRFFNVYGTRSRTSGTYGAVFGVFLKQKLENKPFTVVGDGSQKRDFTYVSDVVNGLILAGNSKIEQEIINIGSGEPKSINELVNILDGEIVYLPKRPGEPEITYADITKAKKLLNYEPVVSFEEGVKKVLDEIDYWESAPLWTPENIKQATRSWFEHLD